MILKCHHTNASSVRFFCQRSRLCKVECAFINRAPRNDTHDALTFHGDEFLQVGDWQAKSAGEVGAVVQDDGAGIPPEMLTKIFDKLETDPSKDGTGLGLTIVKQIVEAHGGMVTVESTLGAGAVFRFTLPAQAAN